MKACKPLTSAVAAAMLAGAFSMPVAAQTATAPAADNTTADRVVEVERDDDGFDWGLLGLLGLLGLIPRKRHDTVVRHDTPRH